MKIREVLACEYEALGTICVQAYEAIGHFQAIGSHAETYRSELSNVEARTRGSVVCVAVDAEGAVLGGVTYIPDHTSPLAEFSDPQAASFRMLAVAPQAHGRGVGRRLVAHCLERARVAGKRRVIVHSTPWMSQAHGLYQTLGFQRTPALDWHPVPEVPLLAFIHTLD